MCFITVTVQFNKYTLNHCYIETGASFVMHGQSIKLTKRIDPRHYIDLACCDLTGMYANDRYEKRWSSFDTALYSLYLCIFINRLEMTDKIPQLMNFAETS